MRCPDSLDLAVRYFIFRWMFDLVQIGIVIGLWELMKWLYRMTGESK